MNALSSPLVAGLIVLVLLGLAPLQAQTFRTDLKNGAEVFPASTSVYVELTDPSALVRTIREHRVTHKFLGLPAMEQAMQGAEYKMFRGVLAFIELQLGGTWPTSLDRLAGRGIYFGADPKYEGAALLIHTRRATTLHRARDLFIKAARDDAKKKGKPVPVRQGTYRSIDAFQIGKARFAVAGDWLVVTDQEAFGKVLIDNLLGKGGKRLAANPQFAKAREAAESDRDIWGYVDLDAVRKAGLAKDVFAGRSENPIGELVMGGLLATLKATPYATITTTLKEDRVEAVLHMPHDRQWVPETHDWFFPEDAGQMKEITPPDDALLVATMPRDFSRWWLSAPDLYEEQTLAKVMEADTHLNHLFGGQDFGSDILAAARSDVQLVLAPQDFAARTTPVPALKLPAAAIVVPLKEDKGMARRLKNTFHHMIGFLNVVSAQKHALQFELDMDLVRGGKVYHASPVDQREGQKDSKETSGKMAYNFVPALGLAGAANAPSGEVAIIGSSRELVETLLANGYSERGVSADPLRLNVRGGALAQVLGDNRDHLITKGMLEDGKTRKAATYEVDLLLEGLAFLDGFSARLTSEQGDKAGEGVMTLHLNLGFAE